MDLSDRAPQVGEEYVAGSGSMSGNDAHEVALELMKQLITLSSGVLALSATFVENFTTDSIAMLIVLLLAWLSLVVSVYSGLETISAIVKSRLLTDHDWSEGVGRRNATISKYAFISGLTFFAVFAFITLVVSEPSGSSANCSP